MVTFELRSVAGGWEQARFGPSDQVDYALYDGDGSADPVLTSYDSVHTLLRLYDLADQQRTTHPAYLGATLRATEGHGTAGGTSEDERGLELSIHGITVETTYTDLRAALRALFVDLFPALDRETPGERPDLSTFDVCVTDLARLYDDVLDEGD